MLIYLASPYTPKNRGATEAERVEIRHQRFVEVCTAAAILMEIGYQVFCPIAHSHPIEVHGMTKIQNGDFWLNQDFAVLRHCGHVMVCTMDGWQESYGVEQEVIKAYNYGIPVTLLDMDFLLNCKLVSPYNREISEAYFQRILNQRIVSSKVEQEPLKL